ALVRASLPSPYAVARCRHQSGVNLAACLSHHDGTKPDAWRHSQGPPECHAWKTDDNQVYVPHHYQILNKMRECLHPWYAKYQNIRSGPPGGRPPVPADGNGHSAQNDWPACPESHAVHSFVPVPAIPRGFLVPWT